MTVETISNPLLVDGVSLSKSQNTDEKSPQDDVAVPDMFSWNYIGLYAQYAAVGLLYGSTSFTTSTFCPYIFHGDPNVCSNASSIAFFAWNFKILYAILTDCYRPLGMRRIPYMIFGWVFVLIFLLILAISAHDMSASTWLTMLMLVQFFMMFADVPGQIYLYFCITSRSIN